MISSLVSRTQVIFNKLLTRPLLIYYLFLSDFKWLDFIQFYLLQPGISLKLERCHFGAGEVTLLRLHVISSYAISTAAILTAAISTVHTFNRSHLQPFTPSTVHTFNRLPFQPLPNSTTTNLTYLFKFKVI